MSLAAQIPFPVRIGLERKPHQAFKVFGEICRRIPCKGCRARQSQGISQMRADIPHNAKSLLRPDVPSGRQRFSILLQKSQDLTNQALTII